MVSAGRLGRVVPRRRRQAQLQVLRALAWHALQAAEALPGVAGCLGNPTFHFCHHGIGSVMTLSPHSSCGRSPHRTPLQFSGPPSLVRCPPPHSLRCSATTTTHTRTHTHSLPLLPPPQLHQFLPAQHLHPRPAWPACRRGAGLPGAVSAPAGSPAESERGGRWWAGKRSWEGRRASPAPAGGAGSRANAAGKAAGPRLLQRGSTEWMAGEWEPPASSGGFWVEVRSLLAQLPALAASGQRQSLSCAPCRARWPSACMHLAAGTWSPWAGWGTLAE
jgi:hypothetical protein